MIINQITNKLKLNQSTIMNKIKLFLFCKTLNKIEDLEEIKTQKNNKANLYLFGNEDISLPTLEMVHKKLFIKDKFYENGLNICSLQIVSTPWTNNNKKQAPFHQFVNSKNIINHQIVNNNWNNVTSSFNLNQSNKLGFVFSFGKMIPDFIIDEFIKEDNFGIFVIHPSLLPKYRGGAPIQHALLNNEKETGISLISTSKHKFDEGDIYIQTKIPIEPYNRFMELSNTLGNEGSKVAESFIDDYYNIISKERVSQNQLLDNKFKKAKIIKDKSQAYLDFSSERCCELRTKFNAFYGSQLAPWSNFTYGKNKRLIFFDNLFIANPNVTAILNNNSQIASQISPGSIYWDLKLDPNNLFINTIDGWMISSQIKVEGYPLYNINAFLKHILKNQKIDKETRKTFANIIPYES